QCSQPLCEHFLWGGTSVVGLRPPTSPPPPEAFFMRETPPSARTPRRNLLTAAALGTAAAAVASRPEAVAAASAPPKVRYCLNMSTIREQKLSLPAQVEVAAKAGYDAIEPWMNQVRQYQQGGGSIDDLRRHIAD